MHDLLAALGLAVMVEGALWVLFPRRMRALLLGVLSLEECALRTSGLLAAALGVALVWLVRG